jgi:membrane protease YdiL (CAAX protease family)
MGAALALSVVVIAYNNAINRWRPFHGGAYVPANLGFVGVITAISMVGVGVPFGDLFPRGDIGQSLAVLLLVAVFAIGAFAIARSGFAHRIADERVAGLRGASLGYHVLVRIPLGTGVTEEVLFRGVLFSVWREAGAPLQTAALCASIAFGLWHIAPTVIALRINDPLASKTKVRASVLGAILATTITGMGLTWLRVVTGGLLGPILLHAGINSVGVMAAVHAARSVAAEGLERI